MWGEVSGDAEGQSPLLGPRGSPGGPRRPVLIRPPCGELWLTGLRAPSGLGEDSRPREAARTALPTTTGLLSNISCSAADAPRATKRGFGASLRAETMTFRCCGSISTKQACTVSCENWLHVPSTATSCGRAASALETLLPSVPELLRSSCTAMAPSKSLTTSRCAHNLSPNSLSNVCKSMVGLFNRSVLAMELITIFVTASQPTFACFASCCTNLSEATATFTSPATAVRSNKIGNTLLRPMLTSNADKRGASLSTV
mmetsp:Transcript_71900/g.199534  ORF Transcript_71900/g.199534 Transcript_71900/m.199534 type:complete len:258 (-) Transcript_71900:2316-3089(-)